MSVRLVKEQGKYIVLQGEKKFGTVETSVNAFHAGNCYVKLSMERYDINFASELFETLIQKVKCPIQIMLSSEESEQIAFLEAGGFQCKRKCYEVEVCREDYLVNPYEKVDLGYCEKGSAEYDLCGRLLFEYYAETHKAINPLTVDYETFAEELPENVYYQYSGKDITSVAFVEGNEIAYVASVDKPGFEVFARTVVEQLLDTYDVICFEADDCDQAAMELHSLFGIRDMGSYNTYLRKESV